MLLIYRMCLKWAVSSNWRIKGGWKCSRTLLWEARLSRNLSPRMNRRVRSAALSWFWSHGEKTGRGAAGSFSHESPGRREGNQDPADRALTLTGFWELKKSHIYQHYFCKITKRKTIWKCWDQSDCSWSDERCVIGWQRSSIKDRWALTHRHQAMSVRSTCNDESISCQLFWSSVNQFWTLWFDLLQCEYSWCLSSSVTVNWRPLDWTDIWGNSDPHVSSFLTNLSLCDFTEEKHLSSWSTSWYQRLKSQLINMSTLINQSAVWSFRCQKKLNYVDQRFPKSEMTKVLFCPQLKLKVPTERSSWAHSDDLESV